jgi:hypothetical protein
MNDGLLASCILIFIVSMAVWLFARDNRAITMVAASMALALNLKFSAVPIFCVLCVFSGGAWLIARGWRNAALACSLLLTFGLAGVLLLGFASYVQNAVYYGHPFYPLMGPAAVDIMQGNVPDALTGFSPPAKLLHSLFAETHSGYAPATLKLPLILSIEEIRMAGGVDVRIAGFGPLFSAAMLLAAVTAALLLSHRDTTSTMRWLLYGAAGVLAAVLILPENWWARYVPQGWYIPLLIALAASLMRPRYFKALGIAVLALMLADAGIVAASSLWLTGKRSAAVDRQIASLKQAPGPYCVAPELAQSRMQIFTEHGIAAKVVNMAQAENCAGSMEIASYGPDREGGRICRCPAQ